MINDHNHQIDGCHFILSFLSFKIFLTCQNTLLTYQKAQGLTEDDKKGANK
jgi:hypothetical protein